jgi:hypothetical protein
VALNCGAQQEGQIEKPSVPKCVGGSQKISGMLYQSSLAVFYVEQVALNRHVRRHFRLPCLCAIRGNMSSGTGAATGHCPDRTADQELDSDRAKSDNAVKAASPGATPVSRYFSISDAQFRTIASGGALGSFTLVLIKNF